MMIICKRLCSLLSTITGIRYIQVTMIIKVSVKCWKCKCNNNKIHVKIIINYKIIYDRTMKL